jgi:hypothetical protein
VRNAGYHERGFEKGLRLYARKRRLAVDNADLHPLWAPDVALSSRSFIKAVLTSLLSMRPLRFQS